MNRDTYRQTIRLVALWFRIVIVLLLAIGVGLLSALLGGCATPASRARATTSLASAPAPIESASAFVPSPFQSLASGAATSASGPASNRTVRVTLSWDAAAEHRLLTNYAVHYGAASGNYTNVLNAGTNLSLTVSNLLTGVRYYFAVAGRGPNAESPLSPESFWPQPITNYIGVGIKTNGRVIVQLLYTNPPGDVVLFEPFIWLTNSAANVLRLPTGNLSIGNTNQP